MKQGLFIGWTVTFGGTEGTEDSGKWDGVGVGVGCNNSCENPSMTNYMFIKNYWKKGIVKTQQPWTQTLQKQAREIKTWVWRNGVKPFRSADVTRSVPVHTGDVTHINSR